MTFKYAKRYSPFLQVKCAINFFTCQNDKDQNVDQKKNTVWLRYVEEDIPGNHWRVTWEFL